MTTDVRQLRDYYSRLTDEELRSQHALGPEAFATPEVWSVVESAFEDRFASSPVAALTQPIATADSDKVALGPWFIVERLAGRRWPSSKGLPTLYLSFMAGMAGLWTIVSVLAVVAGWTEYFGYHLYPDHTQAHWLPFAGAIWSGLFFVAASTPRPWAWHYLVWASLASCFFRPLAAVVWYPFVWLYLARRRNQFGLAPWLFVM
jgi:hypothetical protein